MKITKFEHACLNVTNGTSRLVIDPGVFTTSLDDFTDIDGLVITHVHADHLDEDKVKAIIQQNPDVQIFATQQVADKLADASVTIPEIDNQYSVGDITLEFFGGEHAIILAEYPQDQNLGVLVNDKLYYPGDSVTSCPKPHTITAVPSVAPWLKLSEAADFIKQDTASQVFPTHNAIVNETGDTMINNMLSGRAEQSGKKYTVLQPGESIEA